MSTSDVKGEAHLRPYQEDAIRSIADRFDAGVRRLVVVAPTGSGKTVLIGRLAADAVARAEGVLVVAHRRELIQQTYRKLADAGVPEEQVGILMASDVRRRPSAPVQVASIDTLRHRAKPPADLVILDEAHRELAKSCADMRANYPNARHLGFTATPYRADNRGLGEFYEDILVVTSIAHLIALGFLVEPRVFTVPKGHLPNLAGVRVRGGEYDQRDLDGAVDQSPLVGNIVEHWKTHASDLRTVAFAVSVKHSKHIAERFRDAGIAAEHLDGTTSPVERDAILARLDAGNTQVVSNCGVLCLDAKTEILTTAGWTGIDAMTPLHLIANWDDGQVTFEPPADIYRRQRLPGERMASLCGRSIDIRVTEGHGIVHRGSRAYSWRKRPARELVARSGDLPACGWAPPREVAAPICARAWTPKRVRRALVQTKWNIRHLEGQPESVARAEAAWRVARRMSLRHKDPSDLTLAECRFIGFWLGDGSVQALQRGGVEYKVFESSRNANIVAWLERVVDDLRVDFIKRTLAPHERTQEVKYRRTAPCFAWSFPRGTGGGSQQRRGLFEIEPYLQREGTDLYWGLDDAQFGALLHGLWMSDGNHGVGADRLPESIVVHNARKPLLDRIQAIAACRGYRTRLARGGTEGMWRLALLTRQTFSIGTERFRLEESDTDERVWCVKTRTGAIITRRNGSAVVLGNCEGWDQPSVKCCILARPTKSTGLYLQQAGRILRPWEGARAIILDHAGCAREHGLPQDERTFSLEAKATRKRGEVAEPSTRECDGCHAVFPARLRICPECGFFFTEPRSVPAEVEGSLVEAKAGEGTRERPERPAKKGVREEWDRALQRTVFEQLRALARSKRQTGEWAIARFAERYGAPPPPEWIEDAWGLL